MFLLFSECECYLLSCDIFKQILQLFCTEHIFKDTRIIVNYNGIKILSYTTTTTKTDSGHRTQTKFFENFQKCANDVTLKFPLLFKVRLKQ